METLELRGKCFFPQIHSLSRHRERMKRDPKRNHVSNESNIRYSSFALEGKDYLASTPSPTRIMPLRTIESVLQNSNGSTFKSLSNTSRSPEKEPNRVLTFIQIKSRTSTKSPLRLTGNLYRISRNLAKKTIGQNVYKRFLETGCQSD